MDPSRDSFWPFGMKLPAFVAGRVRQWLSRRTLFPPCLAVYEPEGAARQILLFAGHGLTGGGLVTLVCLPYLSRAPLHFGAGRTLNPAFLVPVAAMSASLAILMVKSVIAWWMSLYPSLNDRGEAVVLVGIQARLEARRSLRGSAALAVVFAAVCLVTFCWGVP